jgi:hypothetical protein
MAGGVLCGCIELLIAWRPLQKTNLNTPMRSSVQDCANMNRSAPEPSMAAFNSPATEQNAATFHFGSGKQYSASAKQKKCIIQRTQIQPALFGLRAQSLSRRLSA